MKGLKAIANKTKNIRTNDKSTWLTLSYSISEGRAYTTEEPDRYFVTYLIAPQTEEDIKNSIERWLRL